MILLHLLVLYLMTHTSVSIETKVVTTKTGKVQGFVEPSSISGKYVQKFSNIPYGEAPVGKLRFAKPQPKKNWNGTLKPSNVSIACWHDDALRMDAFPSQTKIKMTEDCLILNIWTPYPLKDNRSVMVWIHGGGFRCGLSGTYPGHNFVALGDVVLVTINYRLSELGFLATGDERIKGNFGLFDQRLAMKWVKENIASFGGDPQSITIFGESAGGASVSAHTLSSGSWPYFNRAIMQSGGMIKAWALVTKKGARDVFHEFLTAVNCTNNEELLECLRNNVTEKDFKDLYITNPRSLEANAWHKPLVDEDFFTDHPATLLEEGTFKNDNVIIGITKDEGFIYFIKLLETERTLGAFSKKFWETIKTALGGYSDDVINQAIKLYYPNDGFQSKMEALRAMIDFETDFKYCGVTREAIARSQAAESDDIFYYRFSHYSGIPVPSLYPNGTLGFAAHGVDVMSVFGLLVNNSICPTEDQILSMRMILYWTNFAKNGDPNEGVTQLPFILEGINSLPEWPKFTNSTREYLDMESESRMVVKSRLREKYCEFMKDPEGFIRRQKETSVARKYKAPAILALLLLPGLQIIF